MVIIKNKKIYSIIILFLFLFNLFLTINVLSATTTGDNFSFNTNVDLGFPSWTPSNTISADDGTVSTCNVLKKDYSDYYYGYTCNGFGGIGSTSTLLFINISIRRYCTSSGVVRDYALYLVDKDGSYVGTNKADTGTYYPSSETNKTYVWTQAQISSAGIDYTDLSDSDFGFVLQVYNNDFLNTKPTYIDYAYITVCWKLETIDAPTSFIASTVYGSKESIYLSWVNDDIATATRIQYKIGSYPSSISDGTNCYNSSGTSTTVTGLDEGTLYYFRAWSWCSSKGWSSDYASATATTNNNPSLVTGLTMGYDNQTSNTLMNYTKSGSIYAHIRYNINSSFPTTVSTGTLLSNSTVSTLIHTSIKTNTIYYYSVWTFNSANGLFSTTYSTKKMFCRISGLDCSSVDITIINNTAHATGKYQTSYSSSTGWKVWLNFTGELPVFNHYENLVNTTGTHQHNTANSGYTINSWANYTGLIPEIYLYSNIVNATGTHEKKLYHALGWYWVIWANYTGNTTPIHIINNSVNVTGNFYYKLNNTGYYVFNNLTGIGGSCPSELQLYLYENIINATGTHEYRENETGYIVYANYTGNSSDGTGNYSEDDFIIPIFSVISFSGIGLLMIRRRKRNE